MKKTIAFLLVLCLCTFLCACGGAEQETANEPAEPIKQVPCIYKIEITRIHDTYDEVNVYTVGENISLNNYGQILQVEKQYNIIDVVYDENNLISMITETDKDEGGIGYEYFTYDNGMLAASQFDPDSDYLFSNEIKTTYETDADGQTIKKTDNVVNTDPQDGSKKKSICTEEYEYDENSRIVLLKYYSDGDFDHTTEFTYDENGNLLSQSYKGSDGNEYLRIDLSYAMVDETEVSLLNPDNFTLFTYWDCLIGHIL